MDVTGTEIGQKMRSAIKAKLTELGCYVDDELPDYVMVMVANKRTQFQMEEDLQLFLGDNTMLFVNWLHQVLKKLQEVTITTPLKAAEPEKKKEHMVSKEKKPKAKKQKKEKKADSTKKAKKKDKEKLKELKKKKKDEKKAHKSKKKGKHTDIPRPNIPPLLMNMEKESEPSITDVFAGQILKNHGITIDMTKDVDFTVDKKPLLTELNCPVKPIIDPSTISEPETSANPKGSDSQETDGVVKVVSCAAPREEQIKEINEIEAKIQGLKQKLAEQLDSMSDDEDFLNIRTEAEELMNDFAEDVFQEISQARAQNSSKKSPTPPLASSTSPFKSPTPPPNTPNEVSTHPLKELPESLPEIELKLPKRPVRERLGLKEARKQEHKRTSPERYTPEREPEFWPSKHARSQLGDPPEQRKRITVTDETTDKPEPTVKRLTSKVSVLENRPTRVNCASVVRVRPRPRVATTTSSLLMRAVADAHKSLFNVPPKIAEQPQIKRALVLPMRRTVDNQKIVIQVPVDDDSISIGDQESDIEDKTTKATEGSSDTYIPTPITKKIINHDYVPSGRNTSHVDETLVVEAINNPKPKEKDTQFIVTMDGFNPNAFLAKKLLSEGILDDDEDLSKTKSIKTGDQKTNTDTVKPKEGQEKSKDEEGVGEKEKSPSPEIPRSCLQKKRLSDTSEESDTQVIIKQEDKPQKRKTTDAIQNKIVTEVKCDANIKKRRLSPIVFDVNKKERERERQRTESASSDNHVTVTTTASSHKYDAVPQLAKVTTPPPDRPVIWCRAFPQCRFGASCAYAHPKCKFAAACTKRGCPYSHAPLPSPTSVAPTIASSVVPAANFKSIKSTALPAMCKFYPSCVNAACTFFHPKPCRYGKNCGNKLECNFYHSDLPGKYRYTL